jgi:hypothetical protein
LKKGGSKSELIVGAVVLLAPVLVFSGLYFITPHGAFVRHVKQKEPTFSIAKEVIIAEPALVAKSAAEQAPHCALVSSSLAVASREDVAVFASPGRIPVEGWDGDPLKIDPRFEFQIVENAGEWILIRIKAPIWPPDRTERT